MAKREKGIVTIIPMKLISTVTQFTTRRNLSTCCTISPRRLIRVAQTRRCKDPTWQRTLNQPSHKGKSLLAQNQITKTSVLPPSGNRPVASHLPLERLLWLRSLSFGRSRPSWLFSMSPLQQEENLVMPKMGPVTK